MATRAVLILFWTVVGLDIIGLTLGPPEWHWVTKPLLMPILLAYVLVARWTRGVRGPTAALAVALIASWLADIALLFPGATPFLIGVGLFGVAQACYIGIFLQLGAFTQLRRRWPVPVLYGVVWLISVSVLWPMIDDLSSTIAIALYGLLLATMATVAAGINLWVGLGALIFVVSDFMVGLGAGGVGGLGQAVMATYAGAQFLIITGTLAVRTQRESSDVSPTPNPRPGTTSPAS